jgi:hypothetical protein
MASMIYKSIYDDDIIFKSIDRSHCDPDILMNLKINMQKEMYCFYFIKNLVEFYLNVIKYSIITEQNIFEIFEEIDKPISDALLIEFEFYAHWITTIYDTPQYHDLIEFTDYDKIENYNNNLKRYKKELLVFIDTFITIDLYDESFNSLIILQNLLGIEITMNQLFDILFYYIQKIIKHHHYFNDLKEPIHCTRGIVVNNQDILKHLYTEFPLTDSHGKEYVHLYTYKLDEKFKNDIINSSFNDSYPISTQETPTCTRSIVQICKDDDVIMTITVAGTTVEGFESLKTHFFIFRHTMFDIKSILKKQMYRDLSIIIHSFAAFIFNTTIIFSNLMSSMKDIFDKHGIEVQDVMNKSEISQLINCSRDIDHKIMISDEFKQLWLNQHPFTKTIDRCVTIYQLTSKGGKKTKKYKKQNKKNKKSKKFKKK